MSETVIAYTTVRLRNRARDGIFVVAIGIALLTILGQALFAVTGTLFGEKFLNNIGVARRISAAGRVQYGDCCSLATWDSTNHNRPP